MSLRWRWMLAITVLFAIVIFVSYRWIQTDLRPRYLEALEDSMVDMAHLMATEVSLEWQNDRSPPLHDLDRLFKEFKNRVFQAQVYGVLKEDSSLEMYLTDHQGLVLFHSSDPSQVGKNYSRWNDVYLTLKGEYGARSSRERSDDPTSSLLHIAAPVLVDGKIAGAVSLIKPEASLEMFIFRAKEKLLLGAVILLLAWVSISWLLVHWISRPVKNLILFATNVSQGKRAQIPKSNIKEYDHLAHALQEMRQALDGRKRVEEYAQALTHELKSPLAAIRAAAELSLEDMSTDQRSKFLNNVLSEGQRAHEVIENLLSIASVDRKDELESVEQIDLGELVADELNQLNALVHAKTLTVRMDQQASSTRVAGDPFLLRQAVRNLLQNAIDFSSQNGEITVETCSDNHQLVLRIGNQGPQIPEYAIPKLFDHFFSLPRPTTGKKGSGLGLTFVQRILDLHNGSVSVYNSADGVTSELRLPSQ